MSAMLVLREFGELGALRLVASPHVTWRGPGEISLRQRILVRAGGFRLSGKAAAGPSTASTISSSEMSFRLPSPAGIRLWDPAPSPEISGSGKRLQVLQRDSLSRRHVDIRRGLRPSTPPAESPDSTAVMNALFDAVTKLHSRSPLIMDIIYPRLCWESIPLLFVRV